MKSVVATNGECLPVVCDLEFRHSSRLNLGIQTNNVAMHEK